MPRGGEQSTFHKIGKFGKIIREAIDQGVDVKIKNKNIIFKKNNEIVTFHCGRKGIYPLYRSLLKMGIDLQSLRSLCGYNH